MSQPDWLAKYVERGFRLVFFPTRTKGPIGKDAVGWTTRIYTPEDYHEGDNVGVMTGHEIAPGRYLVDIDLDWPDGLPLTRRLLPPTGFGFGRLSRKISHAFYTTSTPLISQKFFNIGNPPHPYVEIRGTKEDGTLGCETMVPPSIHPSGEEIEFRKNEEIAHDDAIERKVTLYAVGCMLLEQLGHRGLLHDVRLAVAGFLLSCRMTEEETVAVMEAVAEASGNSVQDVPLTVRSTLNKMTKGERVTGSGTLVKVLGDNGKKVLARIREWLGESEFICDAKDRPLPNHQENIQRAFEKLGVHLSFDIFSSRPKISWTGQFEECTLQDDIRNRLWLTIDRTFGFRPSADFFDVVLIDTARSKPFHPVVDYLNSLEWDKTPRLDTWLIRHAKAADTEYVRAVSSLLMIAAVRRVKQPGCKFDELLILESSQGLNKSTAIRALCPNDSWFSDDLPLDVDAKQLIERTTGKWIIETGELSGMRTAGMEHLKAMLSRQTDGPVRLAYARMPVEQARQFVAIGTTNSYAYLSDSTGNRRFWPVRVDAFDVDGLRRERDQLWAEAVVREAGGASIRLPPHLYDHAELQQERRRTDDPWEVILAAYFVDQPEDYRVAPDEVWEILGISNDRLNAEGQRRVVAIMQKLKFRRMTVKDRKGKPVKGWARGAGQRDPVQLELEAMKRAEEEARAAKASAASEDQTHVM